MILAISRAERYSPNSVAKDAAILDCLCKQLMHYGYDVDSTDEISLGANDNRRVYISMARTDQALDEDKLDEVNGGKPFLVIFN